MKISFFEEFPSKNNLSKLKLIKFPTKVYVATRSFDEFKNIGKEIKKINKKAKAVYWPVLRRKEGYWISPFSDTDALRRIFSETPRDQEVMLDLEMPLKRTLILKNLLSFFRNKKIIRSFIKSHQIYLCEHAFNKKCLGIAGLSYNIPENRRIKMIYTSMSNFMINILKRTNAKIIGIGCIATGIWGNEPIMDEKEFERDLRILKNKNIDEVIIFRLGGLDKNLSHTIEKYS
jgi:hypothetical protein